MKTDRKWVVVRIDGKIAGVSTDYGLLSRIVSKISSSAGAGKVPYGEIVASTVGFDEVSKLRSQVQWEDIVLFGTEFQKRVWRKLYDLTHTEGQPARLFSYSDFAELCDNPAGVRAVAHAVGLNPVSVIIPCHLIVPKEAIDKIDDIQKKAASTIFKGDDLCLTSILSDTSVDFGEYALGRDLKRTLIIMDLA